MPFWQRETLKTNHLGHLEIAGCDCVELARQYGTPLYVMDDEALRTNCRAYMQAAKELPMPCKIYYASKALSNLAVLAAVKDEGLCADAVSYGEMITATNAGVAPENIILHGNCKSERELQSALDQGVTVALDGFEDLAQLSQMAKEKQKKCKVFLRIRPGIDAHTHAAITTGIEDSKFGYSIKDGSALKAAKLVIEDGFLQFYGVHCHIGSQILQTAPFTQTVDTLCAFMTEVYNETGYRIECLNIGGGLGVHYTESDNPKAIAEFVAIIGRQVVESAAKYGFDKLPALYFEPGRSIVGEAGLTLYTVGAVKDVPGIRTYVAVDGGMTDNPRPLFYQAEYTPLLAGRMKDPDDGVYTIAGRCCESGDVLITDAPLPRPRVGDTLAVLTTGAYNASMASVYNRLQPPAMVLCRKGKAHIIQKRPQAIELLALDDVPPKSFYK
ncbi:MAG: diaminopimelate decarboxylase [Clostridia bacterium]|nr:diaminopimelate decarboxylase [Clostridia bacterium]